MTFLATSIYKQTLLDLHHLSPDIADLAERIAINLQPEVLATSDTTLQAQLFDHLQAVATRQPGAVTQLKLWLNKVVEAGALPKYKAEIFVTEADKVYYPTGGEPQ